MVMQIKIQNAGIDESIQSIIETFLSPFVNYAKVDISKLIYNQNENWVEIPLSRKRFHTKSTFLSKQFEYTNDEKQAVLRIGEVENFQTYVEPFLFAELNKVFTILFGLKINGNTLYISSAEESQGKQACQLSYR
jgi:hypothetical protein